MAGRIFVAARTAFTVLDGRQVVVRGGMTTAREGHPVLDAHPDLWKPLVPTYEVKPDQKPAKQAAAPEPVPAPAPAAGTAKQADAPK